MMELYLNNRSLEAFIFKFERFKKKAGNRKAKIWNPRKMEELQKTPTIHQNILKETDNFNEYS